ncbi:unnamed protein product [Alopecurus aequalis]
MMRLLKRARTFRRRAATPQTARAAAQTVTKPPIPTSSTTESPMEGGLVDPETEAPPMDRPPAASQRARPANVIERKLGELDVCLTALTSRPRRSDVDDKVVADIHGRTEWLRMLIATERDTQGDARPEHLVEAEEWFAVLERTFEQWAQSAVAAATEEEGEEPDQATAGSGSSSGSGGCSCTGSCSGFEVTGQEAALDAKCNLDKDDAAAHKDKDGAEAPKDKEEAAPVIQVPPAAWTTAPRRRWWKRRAAVCGLAGVVAVVALGAGLALQYAAVAQQSVYVVPT